MRIRVLVLLALARTALADPIVRWQAPDGCPTADDVDARVALRLGSERPRAPIDVAVVASAAGFVATVGGDDTDVRTLTSASCNELADAVALIVARMVLDAPAPPAVSAPVAVAVAVTTEPRDAAPQEPAPRETAPRAAFGIGARLSATGDVGVQPHFGIGGELAVPIHWRAVLVEPAASVSAASTEMTSLGAVAVSLREAALRIGWRPARLPLRVWAAGQLGSIIGTGESVLGGRRGSALWASAGAGAAGVWRFWGPMSAVLDVEVAVPLVRPQFALSDGDVLFRPGPVVGQLALGVEAAWR